MRRRIARERVPTTRKASANQIGKPKASSPRCSLYARVAAPIQDYPVQLTIILDSSDLQSKIEDEDEDEFEDDNLAGKGTETSFPI